MDISFGCSIGFGAKSCLKFHSLDCVKHSQGIGFGFIIVDFFAKSKFNLLEMIRDNLDLLHKSLPYSILYIL